MKIQFTKCEQCDNQTLDHYSEKGWILIGGPHSITLTCGRKKNKTAFTKFKPSIGEDRSFCSFKCLKAFIESGK